MFVRAFLALLSMTVLLAPAASGATALEDLLRDGRFAEAEAQARASIAATDTASDPRAYATLLDALVAALRGEGKGSTPEALALAERSLAIRSVHGAPSDPDLSLSLVGLGKVMQERGEYSEAVADLEKALAIRQAAKGPGDSLAVTAFVELAGALVAAGRVEEAERDSRRAIAALDSTGGEDRPEYGRALQTLGSALLARGAYTEAREAYRRSGESRERVLGPDHPETALALNTLAVAEKRLGRQAEARGDFERALAIAESRLGERHPVTATILNNLAGSLWAVGASEEALPVMRRVLAIREAILPPGHPDVAQAHQNIAFLLEDLGRSDEAMAEYHRALDLYEKALGPTCPQAGVILWKLAGLLSTLGRIDEAVPLSERAVAIGESGPWRGSPEYSSNLEVHARLLAQAGRCEEALPVLDRALAISRASCGEDHPDVARLEVARASLLAALGREDEAFESASNAEAMRRAYLRLSAWALPERQAIDYAGVRGSGVDLLLSLAAEEAERTPARAAAAQAAWDAVIRSRALVLEQMARRHEVEGSPSEPAFADAWSAREDAARRLAGLLVSGPPEGVPAESYQAALDSARAALDATESTLAKRSARFRDERARDRVGFDETAAALPSGAALVAYSRYDRLDVGRCPVEAARASYVAFVLHEGAIRTVPLGDAASIDSLVERWRSGVARFAEGEARAGDARDAAVRTAGLALAERVWTPIAPFVRDAPDLYLVPGGALSLVPFAALPAGRDSFLVEGGSVIRTLIAERDLVSEERHTRGRGLFALGDPDFDASPASDWRVEDVATVSPRATVYRGVVAPCREFSEMRWSRLPATEKEVDDAVSLWRRGNPRAGAAVERLVGASASEAAFKALAPGHEVIHVATHGFFLDSRCVQAGSGRGLGGFVVAGAPTKDAGGDGVAAGSGGAGAGEDSTFETPPLRLSGLVLAGANRRGGAGPGAEDGILTAEEIAALDLTGVDCVVLSACDTGIGQLRAGEGVVGLSRAFLTAGARNLVMSLWSVEDESARDWMDAFYRARFSEKRDIASAAQHASREMLAERRRQGRNADPFFWAGFIALSGSP